ncbi:MAG: hypothetical protein ACFB5Z_15805 [Elainellaceae cyanobacterium]
MIDTTNATVLLTLGLIDSDLDDDVRDEQAQRLVRELRDIEVESAERVIDPHPPKGNKAMGGFIVGLLTAEVSMDNLQLVFKFLGDRLVGKSIELEVEANGKSLRVTAHSQAELAAAIEAAQRFVMA